MTDQAEPTEPEPRLAVVPKVEAVLGDDRVDHIVGMSFDKASRADEVLLNLVHLAGEGEIRLADAVVAVKDDQGRVHIRQTVDITPGRGALSGSLWGLLAGTLFGGPVVGMLVGAGSGALMGKLIDVGLDDGWVRQVGEWLDPGTSALLLLVSDQVRPVVVRELSRFEGKVLYCTFPEAVRRELETALSASSSLPPPAPDRPGIDRPVGDTLH